jgi:hypothetical protein
MKKAAAEDDWAFSFLAILVVLFEAGKCGEFRPVNVFGPLPYNAVSFVDICFSGPQTFYQLVREIS